jgi:hypothetical protein
MMVKILEKCHFIVCFTLEKCKNSVKTHWKSVIFYLFMLEFQLISRICATSPADFVIASP